VLSVRLPENPTTGFRWQQKEPQASARVLAAIGDSYEPSGHGRVGGGGVRIFRFAAHGSGAAALHFTLARPWEQSSAPRETFSLQVEVT
jgi:inhibitor of cysteine peptidase